MSETPNEVEVDLRDEKGETNTEPLETEAETAHPTMDGPEPDHDARAEAKRLLSAADGASQRERVNNALEQAQQSYQRNHRQLQGLTENEQRLERLEETRERVEDQPDDCDVLQTMAGGISLEVPATDAERDCYDRAALLDEIDETIEGVEGTLEQKDTLEAAIGKMEATISVLQEHRELLDDEPPAASEQAPPMR